MAGIKDYSSTAGNNSSVGGISIAEGMLPSNINNAFRAITADIREFYNDSQWVVYGDGDGAHTFAYVSGTAFTVNGANVTGIYTANRRVKAVGSSTGTIFGTISSTSFSTNTTVNVSWDSGSLSSETLVIYISALSVTGSSIPVNVLIPADNSITSAKISNGTISPDDLASNAITTVKILNANITTAKIADNAITAAKIADAVLVTASEHAGHTADEVTLLTTAASDARYFRQDSNETITSGATWSAGDTHVATTAAIDARIIDLVDDVGGFVPIANETSFPNANPDVNNGTGTIISVNTLGSNRTANGSGVISISNGSVGNSTVTINGCGNNVTLASSFGILVETTSTLHTYTFVRLIPKATEVTAVAAITSAITGVNNISSAVSAVNSNATNINTVASANTNVNLVGDSIANVNKTASNIDGVNSFAERYRVQSSNPTGSLDEGDLVFNTDDNNLKFYNGSGWVSIAPGIANVVDDSSPQLGGNLDVQTNSIVSTSNRNIAITPNGSGKVVIDGLSHPVADGSAGQALVTNGSGVLSFATPSSAEVYGFEKYYNPSTLVKTVTVVSVGGANKYFIDGVQQDTLDLYEGNTYIFNYPSAHPFKFSTTSNGSHGGGSEYTTGVTHNSSSQVTIVVATGAPTLYYYCSSHSAMGGTANTPTPGLNDMRYITTNKGADNITENQYANFDDVLFSASGFVFSINSNGNLISTI
jgi:hypothetical protein